MRLDDVPGTRQPVLAAPVAGGREVCIGTRSGTGSLSAVVTPFRPGLLATGERRGPGPTGKAGPGGAATGEPPGTGPRTGALPPGPCCRPLQAAIRHGSLALGGGASSRRPLAANTASSRGRAAPAPSAAAAAAVP